MTSPYPYLDLLLRWIIALSFLSKSIVGSPGHNADLKYLTDPTIPIDWERDGLDTLAIADKLSGEVIYQVLSRENYPIYFYQEVADNVCFDNKCRPIRLKVYWNITGRYLGFCLEDGEFLSKRNHEAFDSTDYRLLHTLLADPLLPFSNLSFDQLVEQREYGDDEVDAVSGATSKQLSTYVVEGAAYTTYSLWSVLYGSAQAVIKNTTGNQLNNELLLKILGSSSIMDQIWGLNQINASEKLDSAIQQKLLEMIAGSEFYVAYTAINAISQEHLQSDNLQQDLFSIYTVSQSNIRKPILEKLYTAPHLSQSLIDSARNLLPLQNGSELGQWLKLYQIHSIRDISTCRAIARLMENENNFIANKAYNFLGDLEFYDNMIHQAMRAFENRNRN